MEFRMRPPLLRVGPVQISITSYFNGDITQPIGTASKPQGTGSFAVYAKYVTDEEKIELVNPTGTYPPGSQSSTDTSINFSYQGRPIPKADTANKLVIWVKCVFPGENNKVRFWVLVQDNS